MIASALHHNSLRRSDPFLSLNCASLSDTLLESQMFGHLRGAFTGAFATQKGLLEEADGGTLFLDEIGDISPAVQGKLLRVIQERDFIPVGSTKAKQVNVRFVAATNKELQREVSEGHFREDLYYRLNVITITLPPLRERKDDIEPLARYFIEKYARRMKKELSGITAEALSLLHEYHWPGNIRELENVVERGVILTRGTELTGDTLPMFKGENVPSPQRDGSWVISLEALEREHIQVILKKTGFHKSRTAEILGISRKTLDRKLADYALDPGGNLADESLN